MLLTGDMLKKRLNGPLQDSEEWISAILGGGESLNQRSSEELYHLSDFMTLWSPVLEDV